MAQPCDKIDYAFKGKNEVVLHIYPGCEAFYSHANLNQHVAVHANISSKNPIEIATAFNITYGMSGWIALAVHAFGVESYVSIRASRFFRATRLICGTTATFQ